MLMTVGEFRDYVRSDINGLITSVAKMSRNVGDSEKQELNASYIQVSKMFGKAIEVNPEFANVNIGSSEMLLEYKLPSASAWCDLVLLGDDDNNNHQVMIVELKNWRKDSKDMPGTYEGSILHNGKDELHPCEQVKGYTEYCRFFHSEVRPSDEVNGCVYFTQKIVHFFLFLELSFEIVVKEIHDSIVVCTLVFQILFGNTNFIFFKVTF